MNPPKTTGRHSASKFMPDPTTDDRETAALIAHAQGVEVPSLARRLEVPS